MPIVFETSHKTHFQRIFCLFQNYDFSSSFQLFKTFSMKFGILEWVLIFMEAILRKTRVEELFIRHFKWSAWLLRIAILLLQFTTFWHKRLHFQRKLSVLLPDTIMQIFSEKKTFLKEIYIRNMWNFRKYH